MANLGDLKARIIAETLRDDLADDLKVQFDGIIQKSIDQYAAVRWWFNEKATSVVCTVGNKFVPLPSDFRFMDAADLTVGGIRYRMTLRDSGELDARYNAGPISGQPTEYAIFGANMWVWPQPSQAYPINLLYVADVSPALDYTNDASANFWTDQGQDLITARAKLRLYRDFLSANLQDPRVVQANNQEGEAYSRLRAEHNRRIGTSTVRPGW